MLLQGKLKITYENQNDCDKIPLINYIKYVWVNEIIPLNNSLLDKILRSLMNRI